jgi:hypothetical protein
MAVNRQILIFLSEIFLQNRQLGLMSCLNNPILDCKARKLGVVSQIEFIEQARAVGIDGFNTDMVRFSNFTIGMSKSKPPENLKFPHGQRVKQRSAAAAPCHP